MVRYFNNLSGGRDRIAALGYASTEDLTGVGKLPRRHLSCTRHHHPRHWNQRKRPRDRHHCVLEARGHPSSLPWNAGRGYRKLDAFMPQGFAGVGAAAAIVFFAYIGFDAISTTAEEAKTLTGSANRNHRLTEHLHRPLHCRGRCPDGLIP